MKKKVFGSQIQSFVSLAFRAQAALQHLMILELTDFSALGGKKCYLTLLLIFPNLSQLPPPVLPILHFHYSLFPSIFYFSSTLAGHQQRATVT